MSGNSLVICACLFEALFRRIIVSCLRRLGLVLGFALLLTNTSIAGEATNTAEEAVEHYVTALLARVSDIRDSFQSDPAFYFSQVEDAIDDFVDFEEVARGVMARYASGPDGASDDQIARFAEVFKHSMIEFYGSALASYGGERFEIIRQRRPPPDPENATNVRMMVTTDDRNRIEIQYTMFLTADQQWKVRNLFVEGVNLRRQYFSRFDNLMQRHGHDIDKVIDSWRLED
jgi:phospholipid transport system substrate-binding protein